MLVIGSMIIVFMVNSLNVRAKSTLSILINGKPVDTDVELIDNTSYVPLRMLGEMLGAQIDWLDATRTISIKTNRGLTDEGTYAIDGIVFSDVQAKSQDYGWNLTADVSNATNTDYKAVHYKATFYDKNGKRAGTADGYTFGLKQGDKKTAELVTSDDLSGYSSIQFQVDFKY